MVTARHRVKMTWEDGGRDQPQAKESQEPPEAEVLRSKEDSTSPWTFGVKMLTPSFQTSGLQHCEKRNFYYHHVCGNLLWHPRELIYLSIRWWCKGNSFAWWVPHYYSESQVKVKCSVMSDSLWPHGLYKPWNYPGQNTRVGSSSLLQGIFPTPGSNPGLLRCGQILY